MFIKLQNPENVKNITGDFKENSCKYKEKGSVITLGGKKWSHLGTVTGELNARALRDLKIDYWMKVIFTLGLALLFSSKTQEMGKTLRSGFQEREILADPKMEGKIGEAVRGIFNPQRDRASSSQLLSGETPTSSSSHPRLSALARLKQEDIKSDSFKKEALDALSENPREVAKYIFEESRANLRTLAAIAEEASKKSTDFFPLLKEETLTDLAKESPKLLNKIPNDLPHYLKIAKKVAAEKPDQLIQELNPQMTSHYKEIILFPIQNNRSWFTAFLKKANAEKMDQDLVADIAKEAVKVKKEPLMPFDLPFFPENKRFREVAIEAVKADPDAWDDLVMMGHRFETDYTEVAAHAVIAAEEKNWDRPTIRQEKWEAVQQKVKEIKQANVPKKSPLESLKEIDFMADASLPLILQAFKENPKETSRSLFLEERLKTVDLAVRLGFIARRAFEQDPQVAKYFPNSLIPWWGYCKEYLKNGLPKIPRDLPNYGTIISTLLKKHFDYLNNLNFEDIGAKIIIDVLRGNQYQIHKHFSVLCDKISKTHPQEFIQVAKELAKMAPHIIESVPTDTPSYKEIAILAIQNGDSSIFKDFVATMLKAGTSLYNDLAVEALVSHSKDKNEIFAFLKEEGVDLGNIVLDLANRKLAAFSLNVLLPVLSPEDPKYKELAIRAVKENHEWLQIINRQVNSQVVEEKGLKHMSDENYLEILGHAFISAEKKNITTLDAAHRQNGNPFTFEDLERKMKEIQKKEAMA